jgi:hypothetical protein
MVWRAFAVRQCVQLQGTCHLLSHWSFAFWMVCQNAKVTAAATNAAAAPVSISTSNRRMGAQLLQWLRCLCETGLNSRHQRRHVGQRDSSTAKHTRGG